MMSSSHKNRITMEENLDWTEKIKLSEVRDPLQLAVFRFPDQRFLPGITTLTLRIRYYTFLTWAWNQIKERKEDKKKILDLEKILALVSIQHHENNDAPIGILPRDVTKEFLSQNSQIDLDKFTSFAIDNKKGRGDAQYGGPLDTLGIKWWKKENMELVISPAGKEISRIFSGHVENFEDKIWSKTLTKSELGEMSDLCCCRDSIPTEEQNFWKNVFFGLTKLEKDNALEIDDGKQLGIIDADKLPFGKINISEDDFIAQLEDGDSEFFDDDIKSDNQEVHLENEMRKATLFLLLEIIKNSKPESGKKLYQTIRDSIYYSEFQVEDKISQINFNQQLVSYRKHWEVYAHNQYYVTIFEKTLSIILDISKHHPSGIEIDGLVRKIDSKEFLDSISKNLRFQISDSDNVQTVYEKLGGKLGDKKTTLSSYVNEHDILENIQNTTDQTETLGLIFVLFLLCKYRYFSFDEKALRMNNAIEHNKHYNISPKTRYGEFSKIQVTKFPEELLRFVINRYRTVSAQKLASNGTKVWLFTVDYDVLSFNDQPKKFNEEVYRDQKWYYVLEIMNDLGLVQKNNKNWEITPEGEKWLKKIQ